jgi:hypothetical protein
MPALIQHIDAIARTKGRGARDVESLRFAAPALAHATVEAAHVEAAHLEAALRARRAELS